MVCHGCEARCAQLSSQASRVSGTVTLRVDAERRLDVHQASTDRVQPSLRVETAWLRLQLAKLLVAIAHHAGDVHLLLGLHRWMMSVTD